MNACESKQLARTLGTYRSCFSNLRNSLPIDFRSSARLAPLVPYRRFGNGSIRFSVRESRPNFMAVLHGLSLSIDPGRWAGTREKLGRAVPHHQIG